MDGERGIGPELDESILAETQVLKTEIALPKAQLYMVESMTELRVSDDIPHTRRPSRNTQGIYLRPLSPDRCMRMPLTCKWSFSTLSKKSPRYEEMSSVSRALGEYMATPVL